MGEAEFIAVFVMMTSMASVSAFFPQARAHHYVHSYRWRSFHQRSVTSTMTAWRWQDCSFLLLPRQITSTRSSCRNVSNKTESSSPMEFPIFYNDVYEVILPPRHRFPMAKYRQVREMVQEKVNSFPESYRDRLRCDFHISPLATVEELTTTHCESYVRRYLQGDLTKQELRNVGFPWDPANVNRALSSVGGTVAAARFVCERLRQRMTQPLQEDSALLPSPPIWAAHVAGGTHHAFFDRGEGFCIFSDIAVATNVVLKQYPDVLSKGVLIIDLDVHQGNGNAKLFESTDNVYTFSMHCEHNLFSARQTSDLDIALPAGCTDTTYLHTLKFWLNKFAENTHRYDLIFFQAGVDVLEEDRLGKLSLTQEGVQRRNEMVFDFVHRTDKPMVITMGGGYPRSDWQPIIEAHADVYVGAHQFLSGITI